MVVTNEVQSAMIVPPDVSVRFVSSPSIFSPAPNTKPTLVGMCTSVVAERLIFAPELMVKSVPSDAIFSLASTN